MSTEAPVPASLYLVHGLSALWPLSTQLKGQGQPAEAAAALPLQSSLEQGGREQRVKESFQQQFTGHRLFRSTGDNRQALQGAEAKGAGCEQKLSWPSDHRRLHPSICLQLI